jgi:hypothetical protein
LKELWAAAANLLDNSVTEDDSTTPGLNFYEHFLKSALKVRLFHKQIKTA